jgi:Fe-S cluster assembly iron-binding protein IscA
MFRVVLFPEVVMTLIGFSRVTALAALFLLMACHGCANRSPESTEMPAPAPTATAEPKLKAPIEAPSVPIVELTPAALAHVKEVVASSGLGTAWVLRLEASWSPTICSPQHNMHFDVDHAKADDLAVDSARIKLIVLKRQAEMLRGTKIDFGEKNGEHGFIINTPNFKDKLLEKWGPILAADPLSTPK